MKLKLCVLFTALFSSTLLFANFQDRVELMKYVIEQEALHPVETQWSTSFFERIKLIEEAQAYKEGDTCLILGFKSQFKNGMCRLSKAEGAKEYKSQCTGGTLPCNPHVFGKPSAEKPFCVAQSSGSELSKYCAHKTFSHLAQKSKSPLLKDVAKTSARSFDLNSIDLSKMDTSLSDAFSAVFSAKDSSVDSAVSFMNGLCEDLKAAHKSGLQPLDLKNCQQYLSMLEKTKKPEASKVDGEKVAATKETEEKTVVSEKASKASRAPATLDLPQEDPCTQDGPLDALEENIQDIKKVVTHGDSDLYLTCIKDIEKHSTVKKQFEDIDFVFKQNWDRLGYWHDLGGEKSFGLLCKDFNESETAPKTFVFLNTNGFHKVTAPRSATDAAHHVSKISYKNKDYFVVRDMLGSYFELYPKGNLGNAKEYSKSSIKAYEDNAASTINKVESISDENADSAKTCVKDRVAEYLEWIARPTTDELPDVPTYNEDIKKDFNDPALRARYERTFDELKADKLKEFYKDVPSCEAVLTKDDMDTAYKTYPDRTELYNKMRRNLGMK